MIDPPKNEIEELPRGRIDPVQILEDHKDRSRSGHSFEQPQQRRKGALLLPLRAQIEWCETISAGQRQQLHQQGDIADLRRWSKERRQLVAFWLGPVAARETGSTLQ